MCAELDYLREAAMSKRLSTAATARAAGSPDGPGPLGIPVVYEDISSSTVLVMEEIEGSSVDVPEAVEGCGVPPRCSASRLLGSFIGQILQSGAYHADPHPGNVFVDHHGRLWLLDFGAVGLLDAVSRQALQEIALGMTMGEPLLVARAVRRLGGSAAVDLSALEAGISTLMVETDAGQFDPRIIEAVLSLMTRYGLKVPRAMTTLVRGAAHPGGHADHHQPGVRRRGPGHRGRCGPRARSTPSWVDMVEHELLRAMPVLRGLPDHLDGSPIGSARVA